MPIYFTRRAVSNAAGPESPMQPIATARTVTSTAVPIIKLVAIANSRTTNALRTPAPVRSPPPRGSASREEGGVQACEQPHELDRYSVGSAECMAMILFVAQRAGGLGARDAPRLAKDGGACDQHRGKRGA